MPDFTFEGPGGKQVTITGPEGSTREQAIEVLHQHLGGQQQPVDKDSYYGKLSGMLDSLQKQLAPSWEHNKPSYSPYRPAQPGSMPNDAINPVGNDTQMAAAQAAASAAGGSLGGLGAMAANRMAGANMPSRLQPRVDMNQMPTQQAMGPGRYYGAQPISGSRGVRASEVLPGRGIQEAGDAAQTGLLRQIGGELIKQGGKYAPFPLNHLAKFAPKVLGLEP